MADYYQPAPLKERMIAALADFVPLLVLLAFLTKWSVPFLAPLTLIIISAYILLRDGLEGNSVGKRWRHLTVISLETHTPANWQQSFMRNLFISVPILGLLMMAVEGVMAVLKNQELRRLGDYFGNTLVIADFPTDPAENTQEEMASFVAQEPEAGNPEEEPPA